MTNPDNMTTIPELVGTHTIDGVAEYVEANDARVFLLRIDGAVHAFAEDQDDGYRSMLGTIEIVTDEAVTRRIVPFAPRICIFANVVVSGGPDERRGDFLDVIDTATSERLLRIGTGSSDEYYPYFVSEWTPPVEHPTTTARDKMRTGGFDALYGTPVAASVQAVPARQDAFAHVVASMTPAEAVAIATSLLRQAEDVAPGSDGLIIVRMILPVRAGHRYPEFFFRDKVEV